MYIPLTHEYLCSNIVSFSVLSIQYKKIRNNDLCRLRRECNLPDQAPTPVVLTRSAHGINFDTSFFDPTLNSGIKPIVLMCQENVKEVLSRKGAEVHDKMLFVFF